MHIVTVLSDNLHTVEICIIISLDTQVYMYAYIKWIVSNGQVRGS